MTQLRPVEGPSAVMIAGVLGGLAVIAAVVFVVFGALPGRNYYDWGAVLIGPILLVLTLPLARQAARAERDSLLVTIVMLALTLKLIGALVRYFVIFDVYGGGDASYYIIEGLRYAEEVRQWTFEYAPERGGGDGTHFIRKFTGVVFAIIGPTAAGAFLVFSWLGFLGLFFFYRAFRLAVPHGDHRRYALLVFFLPSLLFWPSSIGKDSWMLLTLGVGAYGGARVLARRHGGYVLIGLGIIGTAAVRPHLTALLAAGLVAALVMRRSTAGRKTGPVVRIISAGIGLGVLLFAVQAAEERFGVEEGGLSGAEQVMDDTAEQTSQGDSEFEARRPSSPRDVPMAVFTVLFRPLPTEAHNTQALLTSLEGLLLMGIFVISWRRLRLVPKEVWRTPYVTFAAVYSLLFMLAFSSVGNFGILARQRAQMLPLLVVLLALPKFTGRSDTRTGEGPGRQGPIAGLRDRVRSGVDKGLTGKSRDAGLQRSLFMPMLVATAAGVGALSVSSITTQAVPAPSSDRSASDGTAAADRREPPTALASPDHHGRSGAPDPPDGSLPARHTEADVDPDDTDASGSSSDADGRDDTGEATGTVADRTTAAASAEGSTATRPDAGGTDTERSPDQPERTDDPRRSDDPSEGSAPPPSPRENGTPSDPPPSEDEGTSSGPVGELTEPTSRLLKDLGESTGLDPVTGEVVGLVDDLSGTVDGRSGRLLGGG